MTPEELPPLPSDGQRLADLLSGRSTRTTTDADRDGDILDELTTEQVQRIRLENLLRGKPALDADGRIVGGVYHGMTPDEVRANRDAYRRIAGE